MNIFQTKPTLAACLTAGMAMTLAMGVHWSVDAAPSSAIGMARSLVRDMASQSRDMSRQIAALSLEIVEDIQEKINDAKSIIITGGSENEAKILIGQALEEATSSLNFKIETLVEESSQLLQDAATLDGMVAGLVSQGIVRSGPGGTIHSHIVNRIEPTLASFQTELDTISNLIEDGDDGEEPSCDSTFPPADPLPTNACDDLQDWLEVFLDDPSDIDPLRAALEIIDQLIGVGTAPGEVDVLSSKLSKSCLDNGVRPCLSAIDKILRDEQRRNAYRRSSEDGTKVSVALGANLARFEVSSDWADGTVRLWSADGRLVGEYRLVGRTLALSLLDGRGQTLPNGVYYYVVTRGKADGTVAQTTVQRLALLR